MIEITLDRLRTKMVQLSAIVEVDAPLQIDVLVAMMGFMQITPMEYAGVNLNV